MFRIGWNMWIIKKAPALWPICAKKMEGRSHGMWNFGELAMKRGVAAAIWQRNTTLMYTGNMPHSWRTGITPIGFSASRPVQVVMTITGQRYWCVIFLLAWLTVWPCIITRWLTGTRKARLQISQKINTSKRCNRHRSWMSTCENIPRSWTNMIPRKKWHWL